MASVNRGELWFLFGTEGFRSLLDPPLNIDFIFKIAENGSTKIAEFVSEAYLTATTQLYVAPEGP